MSKQEQKVTPATLVQHAELYVDWWVKTKGYNVQKIISDVQAAQEELSLNYEDFRLEVNKKGKKRYAGIKQNLLTAALNTYIRNTYQKERQETLDRLKCKEPNLAPLFKWIEAICGNVNEVDAAVIAHWCWMVKQKAQNKDTVYQVMPVLFGPQGSGKTIAIEKLIKPLKDFRLNMHLDKIGDEKYWDGFSKNLIVFFDELSGAKKAELSSLKHVISAKDLSYRKMYSHSVSSVKQACSFIGCTNTNTFEVLWDPTGARRFWEIKTLPKVNWDVINSIDYEELWKGINDSLEHGYMAEHILNAMNKVQVRNTIEDVVSSFIGAFGMTEPGEKQSVEMGKLYQRFDFFCRTSGEKVMSLNRLKNQLASRGFEITMDNSTGRRKNFIQVSIKAAEELEKPVTHLASVV